MDLQAVVGMFVSIMTTFLTVSYLTSNATEALGGLFKWRAKMLLAAVKKLLKDPKFDGLAKELYLNPAVNPHLSLEDDKPIISESQLNALPAFIDPLVFADALMEETGLAQVIDAARKAPANIPTLQRDLFAAVDAKIPNEPLKKLAKIMIRDHAADLIRPVLAAWYSRAMTEVSEAYRRRTQLTSFLFGFLMAAVLDLEPIPLEFTRAADAAAAAASPPSILGMVTAVFEWVIVASSTLFGAEFWYRTLQWATGKTGNGKGTIPNPAAGGGTTPGGTEGGPGGDVPPSGPAPSPVAAPPPGGPTLAPVGPMPPSGPAPSRVADVQPVVPPAAVPPAGAPPAPAAAVPPAGAPPAPAAAVPPAGAPPAPAAAVPPAGAPPAPAAALPPARPAPVPAGDHTSTEPGAAMPPKAEPEADAAERKRQTDEGRGNQKPGGQSD
jgi:hypothetical protein